MLYVDATGVIDTVVGASIVVGAAMVVGAAIVVGDAAVGDAIGVVDTVVGDAIVVGAAIASAGTVDDLLIRLANPPSTRSSLVCTCTSCAFKS